MAQRRALSEICDNRTKRHELTVNQRAQIVDVVKCGVVIAKVNKILNFNPTTVITTVEKDLIRQSN